jgi:hypothetical protein
LSTTRAYEKITGHPNIFDYHGNLAMKTSFKPFVGKWSIVEMEAWDQEYIDMEVPGHFTFNKDGTGHFQFGLVQGDDSAFRAKRS